MTPIRMSIGSAQREFAREREHLRDYLRGDPFMQRFFEVFLFEDVPAADRKADYPENRSRPAPGPPAGRARAHPEGTRRAGRPDAGRSEIPPGEAEGCRSPSPRRLGQSGPLGSALTGADGRWPYHPVTAVGPQGQQEGGREQ